MVVFLFWYTKIENWNATYQWTKIMKTKCADNDLILWQNVEVHLQNFDMYRLRQFRVSKFKCNLSREILMSRL